MSKIKTMVIGDLGLCENEKKHVSTQHFLTHFVSLEFSISKSPTAAYLCIRYVSITYV